MRKARILVITPRYPFPVIGGDRLRIFNLCQALSKDFSLTLLSLSDEVIPLDKQDGGGVFDRVEVIYLPRWISFLSTFFALFGRAPLQVSYYKSKKFAKRVKELLPDHDACLAHLIRTSEYVSEANCPIFLEMTDSIALNYLRIKNSSKKKSWKEWVFSIEAGRLLEYERRMASIFSLLVFVSDKDVDFLFGEDPPQNVLVCSNGVDLPVFQPELMQVERVVVFIGNMLSVQNLDACEYFIQQILPKITTPGVRFRVVGRIAEKDKVRLSSFSGVEVTGEVGDVRSAVLGTWVGVAPMRLGAGVQNKVLEYMSFGLPTVSTSIGYEGFYCLPNCDLLLADTPEAFAACVDRLLSSSEYAKQIAHSARSYVEGTHGWKVQLAPLVNQIKLCIGEELKY